MLSRILRLRFLIAPVVLAAALGAFFVAPSIADDRDHESTRARRLVERGEILPLETILFEIRRVDAGEVIEVELDRDDGRWIYEIKTIADDGRVTEIEVDARTGRVLEMEVEHAHPRRRR